MVRAYGRPVLAGGRRAAVSGRRLLPGRLWEDVNVLTPDILEAVPDDLQSFIATDSTQWACDPLDFVPEVDDGPDHPVVTAVNWHSGHYLDFGYLRHPPHLRLWRTVDGDRDEITLDWQHVDDGEIGFAQRCSVPTEAYVEAVHTLDRELMTAMHQRIQEPRPHTGDRLGRRPARSPPTRR
ncbi:DUF5984 family protein [Actinoplanes sp. NPDC048791]|uniref:DUF5984 family protein n=1 Tax=Actinoplanes sp. NPDC048791 TaxID=3154623 RepID=UPI0033D72B02